MALPENIYTNANIVDDLFYKAVWLTSVTFVIVLAILFFFIIRYRARPGHVAFYTLGNSPKALGLTVGLAIAVFVGIDLNLAWSDHLAFESLYGSPPKPADALVVQVFAKQFEWNFRTAGNDGEFDTDDDICTINDLTVPVDRPVILQLRSIDVIHSFFLPYLRLKQDVVPGLQVMMWFQVNRTTASARQDRQDPEFDYEIACAELCGLGHTNMRSRLTILDQAAYTAWAQKKSTVAEQYDRPEIWDRWPATAVAPAAVGGN